MFIKKIFCLITALAITSAVSSAEVYGSYSNGCIRGAVPLNMKSPLYQVQIWGQGRNYGHPMLIKFIEELTASAEKAGLPHLLIGDLSKHYGGPFGKGSSHGSHQTGLDVDISFDFATPRKTQAELKKPKDVLLVQNGKLTRHFDKNHIEMMKLTAQDPRVERIFVAPQIKRGLCETIPSTADRSWLRKIRPWFGHRGHMHVRLTCPPDSPGCKAQAAPPEGDGCGAELLSWFQPPKPGAAKPKPKPRKVLPKECELVLKGR